MLDRHAERNGAPVARQLLNEVGTELPRLKGSMRSRYLEQKTRQFRRSVDLSALNSATLLEFHLLEFLDAAARVRWQGGNYETRVRALSSINVTFDDLDSQLRARLDHPAVIGASGSVHVRVRDQPRHSL